MRPAFPRSFVIVDNVGKLSERLWCIRIVAERRIGRLGNIYVTLK